MKKQTKVIIAMVVAAALLGGIGILLWNYYHTPKADVVSTPPQKAFRVISGTVINANGKPVSGAVVYVGQSGAATNANGFYSVIIGNSGVGLFGVSIDDANGNQRSVTNTAGPDGLSLSIDPGQTLTENFQIQ